MKEESAETQHEAELMLRQKDKLKVLCGRSLANYSRNTSTNGAAASDTAQEEG